MTKYKSWKQEERVIAKAFNTVRALGLGSDEKSDIKSDLFAVDCKCRKNWSIARWFAELKKYADKKGKIPILTVRTPGTKTRLAVLPFDNLISIMKGAGLIDTDSDKDGGIVEKTES